ncbi:MAG: META domain-containing protein [Syntrophomonadaceae bacterium]
MISLVAAAVVGLAALGRGDGTPRAISGTITCPDRGELPADASVRLWLETEPSRHQPARHVATTTFAAGKGRFPIAYSLPYAADEVAPGVRYQLRAVISSGKRVLFFTRIGQPAPMDAPSPRIDVPVEPFGAKKPRVTVSSTNVGLSGEWRLTGLPGTRAAVDAGVRAPTLVITGTEKRVSGSTGCNQFFGSAAIGKANALSLDPSGMTRMACPDAATALEDAYLAALRATTAYRVEGATLELLGGERILARFERRRPDAPSD